LENTKKEGSNPNQKHYECILVGIISSLDWQHYHFYQGHKHFRQNYAEKRKDQSVSNGNQYANKE